MFENLFFVLVGAFVGWHFPQPKWAAILKEKFLGLFKSN